MIANGFDREDLADVSPVVNQCPTLLYAGACYGSRPMTHDQDNLIRTLFSWAQSGIQ